jgi:hypothetical protein
MRIFRIQSNILESVLVERDGETLYSPLGRFGPTYRLDAAARERLMTMSRRFDWLSLGAIMAVVLILAPTMKATESLASFGTLLGASLVIGGLVAGLWLAAQTILLKDSPRLPAGSLDPAEIQAHMLDHPPVSDRALVGFMLMWVGFMLMALVTADTVPSLPPATLACVAVFALGLVATAWQLKVRLDYLGRRARVDGTSSGR